MQWRELAARIGHNEAAELPVSMSTMACKDVDLSLGRAVTVEVKTGRSPADCQQSNRASEVMTGTDSRHPFGERPKKMSYHGTFRRRGWEFKRSTVAIGLGALVFTVCSMGDTFEIIEGKGVGVCQAYLSAVQKWEPDDMACLGDRPLDAAGIARISAPIWEIEDSTVENGPGYNPRRLADNS